MEKTPFTDILNGLTATADGQFETTVTSDWMQGRTVFGGFTAALLYAGTEKTFPDLPPIRSMLMSFVGPVGGKVSVRSELLRQGRSVAHVSADLFGEDALAARAILAFGARRESKFAERHLVPPSLPDPEKSVSVASRGPLPMFAQNFDSRLARGDLPVSSGTANEHYSWIRHLDEKAGGVTGLLAIADMPPPAIMSKFDQLAAVSSMTWGINFIGEHPTTDDGWWLVRTAVETAEDGYSSQDMTVWNRAGDLVMTSRQNVAVFL